MDESYSDGWNEMSHGPTTIAGSPPFDRLSTIEVLFFSATQSEQDKLCSLYSGDSLGEGEGGMRKMGLHTSQNIKKHTQLLLLTEYFRNKFEDRGLFLIFFFVLLG